METNYNLPPGMSTKDIPGNDKRKEPQDNEKYCPVCDVNVEPKPVMDALNDDELLISINCPNCGYEFEI